MMLSNCMISELCVDYMDENESNPFIVPIQLWNKLKDEKHKEKFQPANEEEYEDTQGNVVNKKTYEDLKRQGLL